jgi:GDPmannose 4,6-dehydratase
LGSGITKLKESVRKVVIVGAEGQDGSYLWQLCTSRAWSVVGIDRDTTRASDSDWTGHVDIRDPESVFELLDSWQPSDIYYLAGFHRASESQRQIDDLEEFTASYEVHVASPFTFLEGIRTHVPAARFFYAASSHVFDPAAPSPLDEQSPMAPNSLYGLTKAQGVALCRFFRETHGVFASTGLLFNHESELRNPAFVSRKITSAAAQIKHGLRSSKLVLGDLSAEGDWGYAPDFVAAFAQILRLDGADDFVVATGERHCVRDFAEVAFGAVGLNWPEWVEEGASVLKRRTPLRLGNSAKLRAATGWQPQVDFEEMVKKMVTADLELYENGGPRDADNPEGTKQR